MTAILLAVIVSATPPQAKLGVNLRDQRGIVVNRVETGSAAFRAGLIPGDRIISFNREPLYRARQVTSAVNLLRPRETVELGIVRQGQAFKVRADLGFRKTSRVLSAGYPVSDPYDPALPIALAHYKSLDHKLQRYAAYVSNEAAYPAEQKGFGLVLKFTVASTSTGLILEHHLPAQLIGSNVYYLDIKQLNWFDLDTVLAERYDYFKGYDPVTSRPIIRGDWLITEIADTTESTTYYDLLYGRDNTPANEREFFDFWGVDAKAQSGLNFGIIETKSSVSKQLQRRIEHFVTVHGKPLWLTRDVLHIVPGRDPLQKPAGNFLFDGSEYIVGIPKVSLTHKTQGHLQAYLLAAGNGNRVEEAPVDLVEDYTRARDQAAILNVWSCIQCHGEGMKPPTEDGLAALYVGGVNLYADGKAHQAIQAFTQSGVAKELSRNNADYADMVFACNGLDTFTNAAAFRDATVLYYSWLDIDRAARELFTDTKTLQYVILLATKRGLDLGPRVPAWLAGGTMPRTEFEVRYLQLLHLVNEVRAYQLN